MEATVVNLIEPNDSMVVCINGVFGNRMADVASRAGAKVTLVERPWGEVFEVAEVERYLLFEGLESFYRKLFKHVCYLYRFFP